MTSAENTATSIVNTAAMNPKIRDRRIGIENTARRREKIDVPTRAVAPYIIALRRQCPASGVRILNVTFTRVKGVPRSLRGLRGDFGILDSNRSDVHYEFFYGHHLDRLELLLAN